jgi:hypothetical protein
MKNKLYPALLRPSNLYNEIKKRIPKSRETIPLKRQYYETCTVGIVTPSEATLNLTGYSHEVGEGV